MFSSIGFFEIVLIAGVALMVLGPEKFPEFAKISMRTFKDLRKYMTTIQRDIATELNPMKKELNSLKKIDVERYVDNLIKDDKPKNVDKPEDYPDDDGAYNVEPDSSVVNDWYPEDQNEIMPGGDETAPVDEDSAQEHDRGAVPYKAPTDNGNGHTTEEADASAPEREDDFDLTGGFGNREEVVDTDNPERTDKA